MSLAEVEAILKDDYKQLYKLVNNSVGLVAQLDMNTDSIVGNQAVIALEVGREFGTGWRLEGDTMPPGRSVPPENVNVKVKRVYGRYRMTKAEISAMSSNVGAFARAQERRIANLKDSLKRNYALGVWGDGTGALATCGTTTASTTVQLAASTPEAVLINLVEGKQIDIGTVADPQLVAADRRVVSVDFDNATVTITGPAVTTTSADFIFEQGVGGAYGGAAQRIITGIQNIVDDTSGTAFQGLTPASQWNWAAFVDGNSGTLRPPTENLLERVVMRHGQRSGMNVKGLWAGGGVYRSMVNGLKGRQRSVDTLELKGGHTGIDYTFGAQRLPLVYDMDAEVAGANSLWGLDYDSMQVYVQDDFQWEDTDGQVLRLATDDTHSFEAIYYSFRELGCTRRNANFRIDDLETA